MVLTNILLKKQLSKFCKKTHSIRDPGLAIYLKVEDVLSMYNYLAFVPRKEKGTKLEIM